MQFTAVRINSVGIYQTGFKSDTYSAFRFFGLRFQGQRDRFRRPATNDNIL